MERQFRLQYCCLAADSVTECSRGNAGKHRVNGPPTPLISAPDTKAHSYPPQHAAANSHWQNFPQPRRNLHQLTECRGCHRHQVSRPLCEHSCLHAIRAPCTWRVIHTARIVCGYVTVGCPSVRLSVCPIYRPPQQRAAGLLLGAPPAGDSERTAARRTAAANATSVTFTAAVEKLTTARLVSTQ